MLPERNELATWVLRNHREWYRTYFAISGAWVMIPRQVFREGVGFNERYRLAYGNVEICLRVKKHRNRVF